MLPRFGAMDSTSMAASSGILFTSKWCNSIIGGQHIQLEADGTSSSYIDGATSPGVTLQGTLMNHSRTIRDVDEQVAEYKRVMSGPLTRVNRATPHFFGEANSLYFQTVLKIVLTNFLQQRPTKAR